MRARTMAWVRRFLCALPRHWGGTNLVGHGKERPTVTGYGQQICGASRMQARHCHMSSMSTLQPNELIQLRIFLSCHV